MEARNKMISVNGVSMQIFNQEDVDKGKGLPQDMVEAFLKTAVAQRSAKGCPETTMRDFQHYFGGGVLSNVIEHVGDLTHRLTHKIKYNSVLEEYVSEKLDIGITRLSRGQGFVDEHETNLFNNAEYNGVPLDEMKEKVGEYLKEYAEGHRRVPVFNRIQWLAREAAIQLGEQNFDKSLTILQTLNNEMWDLDFFKTQALMVKRDEQGNIAQFEKQDLFRRSEPEPDYQVA